MTVDTGLLLRGTPPKTTFAHLKFSKNDRKNNRNNSILFKNNGLLSFAPLNSFLAESQGYIIRCIYWCIYYIFSIRLELLNFYPRGKLFVFDSGYIIRCLLLKYFSRLYAFGSPKGSSNTFKTPENISLYFKRWHLITYKYLCD